MAGDLLYFIHRHFRAFAVGSLACMVSALGLTVKSLVGA